MANATVTVKASGGDYTTLNAALAGEAADLTANCHSTGGAGILTIECYAMEDTTAASTGTGYTTSADYYINITVPAAERHDGKWNTSKYRLIHSANTAPGLNILEAYVRITGMQFNKTEVDYDDGLVFISAGTSSSDIRVESCIFKGPGKDTGGNYSSAVQQRYGDESIFTVRNCLIYDWIGSVSDKTAAIWCHYGTCTIQNVSIVDCQVGIGNSVGTVTSTNVGMSGVTTATSGTVSQTTNSTSTPTFVNASADDFHLASNDTTWKDAGTALSGTFTTDIDSQTRSGTWDIGADEYVAAATASLIPRLPRKYKHLLVR